MHVGMIEPGLNFGKMYEDLAALFTEYSNIDEAQAVVGIMVEGPAAAYADVWEWGNARQTKKGPKTTRGINPDGSSVWLTITAPHGYIRTNIGKFWTIIDQEIGNVDFEQSSGRQIDKQIKKAARRIGERVASVIAKAAPYDTGDLSESIRAYTEISMVDDSD